jgi:RHS repeat-associated protein
MAHTCISVSGSVILRLRTSDNSGTSVDPVLEITYTLGGGETTTGTRYIHADHLGSANVVTDDDAGIVETLDYYPYGAERISTGADATDRHYIGERLDDETDLSYLNARYYGGERGQFISQDPVFLALGDARGSAGQDRQKLLSDPQQLHSYSYGRSNPIVMKDPDGEAAQWAVLASRAMIIGGAMASLGLYATDVLGNYVNSGTSFNIDTFKPTSSGQDYIRAARDGAVVGLAAEFGGLPGAAAGSGFASSPDLIGNRFNGDSLTRAAWNIGEEVVGTAFTRIPLGVRGADVSTFGRAFLAGAHTRSEVGRDAAVAGISLTIENIRGIVNQLIEQRTQQNNGKSDNKQSP